MSQIYFVAPVGGGLIKIGITTSLAARVRALQASSPVQLELLTSAPGTSWSEFAVHAKFLCLRHHGEWFHPGVELLALVEEIRETGVLPEKFVPSAKVPNPLWKSGRYFRPGQASA